MSQPHVVALLLLHQHTPRDHQARNQLSSALPDASVGHPDEQGVFEIALHAADQDDALTRVWNAIAASGTDDHIVLSSIRISQSTGAIARRGQAGEAPLFAHDSGLIALSYR